MSVERAEGVVQIDNLHGARVEGVASWGEWFSFKVCTDFFFLLYIRLMNFFERWELEGFFFIVASRHG